MLNEVVSVDVGETDTVRTFKARLRGLLGIPREQEMCLVIGGRVVTDDVDDTRAVDGLLSASSPVSVVRRPRWHESRLVALKKLFLDQGEVHAAAAASDLVLARDWCSPVGDFALKLLAHDAVLPDGLQFPVALEALLRHGNFWSFWKERDCFEVHLMVGALEHTSRIFGGDQCRKEWAERHGGADSCAGLDWAMICATWDYEFTFVNLRKSSRLFGATRHIVTNHDEEEAFTDPPFDNFLDEIEGYARRILGKDGEGESDIEDADLSGSLESS